MFGLGYQEFLIIFAILLLLFGARRLPELGRSLGKSLRGFKAGVTEVEATPPPDADPERETAALLPDEAEEAGRKQS